MSPRRLARFLIGAVLLASLAGWGWRGWARAQALSRQVAELKAITEQLKTARPVPAAVPLSGKPSGGVGPRLSFPPGRGKVAIVLDDWGYNPRRVSWLSSVGRPLTIAVLPRLAYSKEVAAAAHRHGHEVILHLPMEAVNPEATREEGTLLTTMSRRQILERLEQSLASVPHARGISNHQGSKATADAELMKTVLSQVKQRHLYFLDSRVTPHSLAGGLARQMRVPFAERAVFLDHRPGAASIRQQLLKLAEEASRSGSAIGIGHDRAETIQVLEEALAALERAGYTLVPVSELVE